MKLRHVPGQRARPALAYEPGRNPGRQHADRYGHAGAKDDGTHRRVALWEELEVRHIAVGNPARTDRMRILAASEILPAVRGSPCTLTPLSDGFARIAEHTFHRREPWWLCAGCDAVIDAFDRRELRT